MELSEIGVFVSVDMAKTDHFARRNADRLVWLDVGDEPLLQLRVLNGRGQQRESCHRTAR